MFIVLLLSAKSIIYDWIPQARLFSAAHIFSQNFSSFCSYRSVQIKDEIMKYFISSLLLTLFMNLAPMYGQDENSLLSQAQQAFAEEKFSETVALLQQKEITAQSYELLLLLGDARQKNEEYALAIEAYNQAELLNNSDAELY